MPLCISGLSLNMKGYTAVAAARPVEEEDINAEDIVTDIKAVSAADFHYYELWIEKLVAYLKERNISHLAEVAKDCNVKTPMLCYLGNLRDISTSLPRDTKDIMAAASKLGVRVISVVPDPFEELTAEEARASCIEPIRILSEEASKYGINLGVELLGKHLRHYINDVLSTIDIIEKVDRPNVGMCFDTFHFYVGDGNVANISKIPKDKIFWVHVNDCKDKPKKELGDIDRIVPGLGILPLDAILTEIKKRGYNGPLSIEILDEKYWRLDPFVAAKEIYTLSQQALKKYI